MSLLTRCPTCNTLFRVVPDQLRISEGWVKCGQCGEIFDGSKQLLDVDADPEVGDISAPCAMPEATLTDTFSEVFPQDTAIPYGDREEASAQPTAEPCPPDDFAESNQPVEDIQQNESLVAEIEPQLSVEPLTAQEDVGQEWVQIDASQLEEPSPLVEKTTTEDGTVFESATFLAPAQPPSSAGQMVKKSLVGIGVVGMFVTIVGQAVFFNRHHLAQQYLSFQPVVEWVASLTSSPIEPLRQIESLAVDAVSFQELSPETYRLSFIVKNNANLEVARPWIELTLTDAEDQPILRRVMSAQELGNLQEAIPAASQWSSSVVLKLSLPESIGRLMGYKLLVFYP
ncbi:DUF3426 domain-containing protein [Rhodoferax sp.]|uniref:DUF3426 domain-containing protein n=1 Tax=Rhodoferax sp. TaxID=50421 RepID=UPI002623E469|nr:DUF3426 domain-containing protein [Rhodoferax sp.]MDD2810148.1 DUF3426 domain-containing protein [Rhodoferax sp.]